MRLMPDEYHGATLLHPFNSPRKEELEEQENLPRLHSAAEAGQIRFLFFTPWHQDCFKSSGHWRVSLKALGEVFLGREVLSRLLNETSSD